jgi:hypothetical protein
MREMLLHLLQLKTSPNKKYKSNNLFLAENCTHEMKTIFTGEGCLHSRIHPNPQIWHGVPNLD